MRRARLARGGPLRRISRYRQRSRDGALAAARPQTSPDDSATDEPDDGDDGATDEPDDGGDGATDEPDDGDDGTADEPDPGTGYGSSDLPTP
jgi:hypothetical protein